MLFIQLLIFSLIFFIVPLAVGAFFSDRAPQHARATFIWVSGQMLLWAVFQVICVPLILLEQSFRLVVWFFGGITVLTAIGGIVFALRRRGAVSAERPHKEPMSGKVKVLWLIFAVLLLVQLVVAVFFPYADGDDAYYVATSVVTVDSEWMYMILPYTGGTTGLDVRHGLAPFPIWVAYLAKVTGITTVTVAQIVLPVGLIVMTYAIYYLVGNTLFDKKRDLVPLFMIFIALNVLFGGYSICAAENFLLVRTAQGKAVLANIVIPFMVFLLLKILSCLDDREKTSKKYWILVGFSMTAGCLCSTLGCFLVCMLLGIVMMCAVVCYKRWKLLLPVVACCIVPFACTFLYFIYR